ncbi:sodium- and chloride-dependent GABA transporter ine isoform X2 [Cyprinodon tularosa]|uniref:sodium- and chloride-dependent GABA transporter ine isoform X2 n=1 Tax=Cyprinodon tularosa TaxID=77115 RepID=UPI0018E206B8|nr:sodium- and chloride-dependent GABA transporter ine isoform X2 [Cyprinodon tularosa]
MERGAENTEPLSEERRCDHQPADIKASADRSVDKRAERPTWSGQLEFILATVGYAVGLGNVWRFPYLCYSSGGGAFIVPYLTMVFLCGIPLLFMEFSVGQYSRLGPVHAFAKICPLFKGVGLATVVISFVFCTFYNVLMSWALFYLFNSFRETLPWSTCNNTWNAVGNCSNGFPGNATHLQSSSQQFFDHKLLEKTSGIEEVGGLQWELFGCLLLSWIIIYLCIFKGVKSTGKVVYFTAVFPYFVLFALLINNVQLPGAKEGMLYFVTPVWGKLFEVKVWVNAAAQVFNSLGIAFGCMISMASYNKFNHNITRDVLIVSLTNSFTSILAGFVIFSAIGHMSYKHNLPVDNIATDGPGLVFVVYPEVLSTMPGFQFWAPLFFIMLLCLGLDSQGGIYVFQLMDHCTAVVSLIFLAFFEVVAVCWIFGVSRLSLMFKRMRGKSPSIFFRFCLLLFCPLLMLCILGSSIIQYTPPRYGEYMYPLWARLVGWVISLVSIVWIPLCAIHEIYNSEGSLLQRIKTSLTPTLDIDAMDPQPEKQNSDNPVLEKMLSSSV